jgi:hypothetical protein
VGRGEEELAFFVRMFVVCRVTVEESKIAKCSLELILIIIIAYWLI